MHSHSWGIFKMAAIKKKYTKSYKNGTSHNPTSYHHRWTLSLNICFDGEKYEIIQKCFLITWGLKIQDGCQFASNIIIDTKFNIDSSKCPVVLRH